MKTIEFEIANSKNRIRGIVYSEVPNGSVFTGLVYTPGGDGEGMFVKANNGAFIAVIYHPCLAPGSKWTGCNKISFYGYKAVNKITVEV